MFFFRFLPGNRARQAQEETEEEALRALPAERIVFIEAPLNGSVGVLSDSQSAEIHRVFRRDGRDSIDAVPIVRRLIHRDITARNVAQLEVQGDYLLDAHFVLDERTRHIFRVLLSARGCVVQQLWGKGMDEVNERPLGPPLISWCDIIDPSVEPALEHITRLAPAAEAWGLSFVSLQTESSNIERRLFLGARGAVRCHTRPGERGTEVAVEIEWQKRIVLGLHETRPKGKDRLWARRASCRFRRGKGSSSYPYSGLRPARAPACGQGHRCDFSRQAIVLLENAHYTDTASERNLRAPSRKIRLSSLPARRSRAGPDNIASSSAFISRACAHACCGCCGRAAPRHHAAEGAFFDDVPAPVERG